MAKAKSKNEIKITTIKKNTNAIKKGANVLLVKNKPIAKSIKKISVSDAKEKKEVKKNVTEDDIARRKERNRRKYQNQQKKYSESNKIKTKKKMVVEKPIIKENKKENNEETLVKKKDKVSFTPKKKELREKEARREKRKTNAIAKTIVNIKAISTDTINSVKEKTDDRKIPVGKTKDEKKQRFKRFVKEAIIYAVIITIINVLLAFILDDVNFLRLFDIKIVNIIATIIISLLFNFFIAFAIDYLVTTIWLKIKRKKSGEDNGNSRVIEEKYSKDITNKEGK